MCLVHHPIRGFLKLARRTEDLWQHPRVPEEDLVNVGRMFWSRGLGLILDQNCNICMKTSLEDTEGNFHQMTVGFLFCLCQMYQRTQRRQKTMENVALRQHRSTSCLWRSLWSAWHSHMNHTRVQFDRAETEVCRRTRCCFCRHQSSIEHSQLQKQTGLSR